MKITDAIDSFLTYISTEKRLSARTVEIYGGALRNFAAFLEPYQISEVEEVTSSEVRQWQMEMIDRGLKAATVKQALSALSSWFRYLRRQKIVSTDVMARVTPPKLAKRLPVFFRESEAERIYDREMFPDTFEGFRDQLILRVLYETGMRRAELCGLREESFNLSALTVKVRGKRNKDRYIPIENELAHNIYEYLTLKHQLPVSSESFFVQEGGEPMTHNQVYRVVKKYMSQLSQSEKVSPHVFRHTVATHLLNEGADLQVIKELLGHSNIGVTEIYTHVTRERMREQYRHAHPRAGK